MKYLFICSYSAPYKGNFIKSMEELEKRLVKNGDVVIYAFPEDTKSQKWCEEIEQRTKVYFLPKSRFKIKTYLEIKKIYKQENIDIVHSHFELYDIPVILMANKNIKVFWHLHDASDYEKADIIHKILNKIQYKYLSKRAFLISVCDYYRGQIINIGMKEENTTTVINGIDLERIKQVAINNKCKYNFYSFGWDYYTKGTDVLLDACERLEKEKCNFNLLLNGNEVAWKELEKRYENKLPSWLIKQDFVEDINEYIKQSGCFIQASRRETFSYAIAEMAYAGIDVITSDIEGTKWAKELPTVQFFDSENSEKLYNLMFEQLKLQKENKRKFEDSDYIKTQNIIKEKYSIDNWVDQIMKVYEENFTK